MCVRECESLHHSSLLKQMKYALDVPAPSARVLDMVVVVEEDDVVMLLLVVAVLVSWCDGGLRFVSLMLLLPTAEPKPRITLARCFSSCVGFTPSNSIITRHDY